MKVSQIETAEPSSPTPPGAPSSVNCSLYGGCDVQVNPAGGNQYIIPLQTHSFEEARARATEEAERGDVFDAVVVGHLPPYIPLDEPIY